MSIQEQINEDLKRAILSRDEDTKSFLRVIIGEFNRKGKDLPDDIVTKELRKLEENAIMLGNTGELSILSKYLPKKLSNDETKIIVENIVKANNITSMREMGKFMGILKLYPEFPLIDNTVATQYVKELLS